MRKLIRLLAIVLGLVLLIVLVTPFLIDANRFRPMLQAELLAALGREVTIGDLHLSLLVGGVSASDIAIADDPNFGPAPFLRARSLQIAAELWPFILSRKLNVTGITIRAPEIRLVQNKDGRWNFSSLGAGRPPATTPETSGTDLDLSVKLVKITNGRFTFDSMVLENVKVEVKDFSAASVFPFSFSAGFASGGSIQLSGKAGPIYAEDAARTPVDARLTVDKFNLLPAGFGGTASLDGTAVSNGKQVEITGKLKGERLRLARGGSPATRPVELDCAISHSIESRQGSLKQGDIHIGKAMASLTGTYDLSGDAAHVNLKLAGSNMPLTELAAMLPALDIVLPAGSSIQGGTASVNVTTAGPLDDLAHNGSLRVDNTRLAGFDLGAKMSTVERLAGIKTGPNTSIQLFSANVQTAADGTRVDAIQLTASSVGDLTGSGTISPTHDLAFTMRAVLHGVGIPFSVGGTAEHPEFKPDVKGMVTGELKSVGSSPAGAAKAASGLLHGILGKKRQ